MLPVAEVRRCVTTATASPVSSEKFVPPELLPFRGRVNFLHSANSDAKSPRSSCPAPLPIPHNDPYTMSGFQDVRDVMDITGPVEGLARPPPAKKQKTVERRPGKYFLPLFLDGSSVNTGIQMELLASYSPS